MAEQQTQPLRIIESASRLSIYRQGQSEPILVQNAEANHRPYIHPIVAPDGNGILTENAPSHHPWQHGLYVGLNDVNGFGFWSEGWTNNPNDGTFHPLSLKRIEAEGNEVKWAVKTSWKEPGGTELLIEEQSWTFCDLGNAYELDLAWTLTARCDIRFGQHSYGGLFLRMPYRDEQGGSFVNSEGLGQLEAEGKRARWAAISMPIEGRIDHAGIAIMDHASNEEHPSPWRVDGQLGIAPSRCIAGEWYLHRGESKLSNYRVFAFNGNISSSTIDSSWKQFVGGCE
jgi:hypothetical protein